MNYRLLIVLVIFALGSCKSPKVIPTVLPPTDTETVFTYWQHSPIHPSNQEQVTFQVKAWDESMITKVELFIREYELYKNVDGLPSKRRKPNGLWGYQKTWEFDYPKGDVTLDYQPKKPFGKHTNIEYIFQITNVQGGVSSRFATFDAGDSPWPNDKVLLYATSPTMMEQNINIAFIKDKDFGNDWTGFYRDVESLVYNGYFENNMIGQHKDKWAFYYTGGEADGQKIAFEALRKEIFPDYLTERRIEGIDAYGLLHRKAFKDGAYLMGNLTFLSTNLFTAESYNIGTAVHETAHAIFNLSDEYEGCVCYQPSTGANMFTTKVGCDAFNKRIGVGSGKCTTLKNYVGENWYMAEQSPYFNTDTACINFAKANGYTESDCQGFIDQYDNIFYRSEHGVCIMQDDGDEIIRDFKTACSAVIMDHYNQMSDYTAMVAPLDNQINIFGYQPVVLMEFVQNGNKVDSKVINVHLGIPGKAWKDTRALTLEMCRKDYSVIQKMNIHCPQMIYAHGTTDGDAVKFVGQGRTYVQIPYTNGLSLMRCQINLTEHLQEKSVSGGQTKVVEVDLDSQLQKAYKAFQNAVN